MEIVRTRRQGNTIAVTLPKKLGIKANQEYYLYKKKDGTIVLVPKVNDIFNNIHEGYYSDANTDNLVHNYKPERSENWVKFIKVTSLQCRNS